MIISICLLLRTNYNYHFIDQNEDNHLAYSLPYLGNDLDIYQNRTRRFAADKFCRRQIYSRRSDTCPRHKNSENSSAEKLA